MNKKNLNKLIREEVERFMKDNCIFEPITYDYLIERHEGLPKEYFNDTRHIPYSPTEYAIIRPKKSSVNEGLIKTYPTNDAIKFVHKELVKNGFDVGKKTFKVFRPNTKEQNPMKWIFGHVCVSFDESYVNKKLVDTMKKGFALCGYYLGLVFSRDGEFGDRRLIFQFEPKYQPNDKNSEFDRYLYHVTTENAANKILQRGFCPSFRGKSRFRYPPRCYFFTEDDRERMKRYVVKANKKNYDEKGNENDNFKVIVVDGERLSDDVEFFADPNYALKKAVFTYSNIPPSAIVGCENLN